MGRHDDAIKNTVVRFDFYGSRENPKNPLRESSPLFLQKFLQENLKRYFLNFF